MARQYKILRVPLEAKDGFTRKQAAIQETLRKITKKPNMRIPLTDILRYFAQKPIYVYDGELASFFSKKKKSGVFKILT